MLNFKSLFGLAGVLALLLQGASAAAAGSTHQVRWLHLGLEALELRLEMIARAEAEIDVEYYIFSMDQTGRAFLQALVARKLQKPDLKIRVLVDGAAAMESSHATLDQGITTAYSQALRSLGIEVRYFHDSNVLDGTGFNRRDHRKFLIIDGKEMITGGRNIANQYFDVSAAIPKAEQYMDRDIWVQGPVVAQEGSRGFEAFFALTPADSRGATPKNGKQLAAFNEAKERLLHPTAEDAEFARRVSELGRAQLDNGVVIDVPNVRLVWNRYSTNTWNYSEVATALDESFTWANHRIVGENFLLLPSDGRRAAYLGALKRGVDIRLLTNSELTSYQRASFRMAKWSQKELLQKGLHLFELSNTADPATTVIGSVDLKQHPFSTHAKSFLFLSQSRDAATGETRDDWRAATGTFNEDGRSSWYNFEAMLFIDGSEAAAVNLLADIERRAQQARQVDAAHPERFDLYKNDVWYKRLPKRLGRWFISAGGYTVGESLF